MTRVPLWIALGVSAAVVGAGPVMGQARAALQSLFPGQYVFILAALVAVGVAVVLMLTLTRIRAHRRLRIGAVTLALALGAIYSMATAVEEAEINAVERVHFIEYGLIALLFYRAWRPAGDYSMLLLPLLASIGVATLDEWLQWFVPVRVGEARDVALNGVAVFCGLMLAVALWPPDTWSPRLRSRSRYRIGWLTAATILVFSSFFSVVHLGHAIHAEGIGEFRSHYTADQLATLARDRERRWRETPPLTFTRYSREDQYLDEGLWHVRRRNGLWAANDFGRARLENLILERFFAPVLHTSTYALPNGARWPDMQRAEADLRARQSAEPFVSDAAPYTIATWRKRWFWLIASLLAAAAAVLPAIGRPRQDAGETTPYRSINTSR